MDDIRPERWWDGNDLADNIQTDCGESSVQVCLNHLSIFECHHQQFGQKPEISGAREGMRLIVDVEKLLRSFKEINR